MRSTPRGLGPTSSDDAAPADGFGRAVALDGGRLLVGAPFEDGLAFNAGAIYAFD